MTQEEVLALLKKRNAVITRSHLVYASGKHGSAYINKDGIYPFVDDVSRLCRAIAKETKKLEIDTVVGPAIGGVILSQWVAYHLSKLTEKRVFSVFAEKVEGSKSFVIKRGYGKYVTGKRVLVVEDVLTTGGSVKSVVEAVKNISGNVVAAAAICNRGGVTAEDVDAPILFAVTNVKLDSWPEEGCPLCAKNIPINVEVGKGAEFLARKVQ